MSALPSEADFHLFKSGSMASARDLSLLARHAGCSTDRGANLSESSIFDLFHGFILYSWLSVAEYGPLRTNMKGHGLTIA
jgi:hypothetical protein